MKKILIILFIVAAAGLKGYGQATVNTIFDSANLRGRINADIIPNNNGSITAYKMNNILNGMLNVIQRYKADSVWIAGGHLYYKRFAITYDVGEIATGGGGDAIRDTAALNAGFGLSIVDGDKYKPNGGDVTFIIDTSILALKSDVNVITNTDTVSSSFIVDTLSNSPPGYATDGYKVLIGTSPTGDFAGHANDVALLVGTTWTFTTPTTNQQLIVDNAKTYSSYQFNGSAWVVASKLVRWGGDKGYGANAAIGRKDNQPFNLISGNKKFLYGNPSQDIYIVKYAELDSATRERLYYRPGLNGKLDTASFHDLILYRSDVFAISNDTLYVDTTAAVGGISREELRDSTAAIRADFPTGGGGSETFEQTLQNQGSTAFTTDNTVDFDGHTLNFTNLGGLWNIHGTNGFGYSNAIGSPATPNDIGIYQATGAFNSKIALHENKAQITADEINISNVAGTDGYTLPTTDGTNGQVLTTNGSGAVSWQTGSGGGSTAWGGITGTLSDQTDLQSALDAKFDAADFNSTFDTRFGTKTTDDLTEGANKYYTDALARAAISLTTTGSSGAATYNSSTGILNIPEYAGGGSSAWGGITGTLSDQTDLQSALDDKFNAGDFNSTFNTRFATKTTDDLTQGSTNKYYTDALARAAFTSDKPTLLTYNSSTGHFDIDTTLVHTYNFYNTKYMPLPSSPSNGDILYYNSGWQKLAKGNDGNVLGLASGLPTWSVSNFQDTGLHIFYARTDMQSVPKLILADTTPATSTVQQWPPALLFRGSGYSGSGTLFPKMYFRLTARIYPGASIPEIRPVFEYSTDSSSWTQLLKLSSVGTNDFAGPITATGTSGFNIVGANTFQSSQTTAFKAYPTTSATSIAPVRDGGNFIMQSNVWNGTTSKTVYNYINSTGIAGTTPGSSVNFQFDNGTSTSTFYSVANDGTQTIYKPSIFSGSTPSYTLGTGAGTSATASISGTDADGLITINTGTTPTAGGDIITVTFTAALTNSSKIQLTPYNSPASKTDVYVNSDSSGFTIKNTAATDGGSAAPASKTLIFHYTTTQ